MTENFTNALYTNDNPLTLAEKEHAKFVKKVEEAWFWYMFEFKAWRSRMKIIKKDYNGFGTEMPNLCIELDDLFANFIEVEVKKSKNKKYQKYLMGLLEC